MFKHIHKAGLKEISINGDRFLLTIPPALHWQLLRRQAQGEEIQSPTDTDCILRSQGFPTYEYDIEADGTHLYRYTDAYNPNDITSGRFLGKSVWHPLHDNPSVKDNELVPFRPCLIPIDKNGEVDRTFTNSVPAGTLFTGGYLFAESHESIHKATFTLYGDQPEDKNSLDTVVDRETTLTITEDDTLGGFYKYRTEPLKWWFINGCLICTKNLIRTRMLILAKTNILPKLLD